MNTGRMRQRIDFWPSENKGLNKGLVSCMYGTKSACNVLMCLIHSAYCPSTNTPCFKAEEDVGEEGSLVHELSWEVISFSDQMAEK